jgi:hypothetical protein
MSTAYFTLCNDKRRDKLIGMDMNTRTEIMQFRATPAERAAWTDAARAEGKTVSDICRMALIRFTRRHRASSSLGAVEAAGGVDGVLPPAAEGGE